MNTLGDILGTNTSVGAPVQNNVFGSSTAAQIIDPAQAQAQNSVQAQQQLLNYLQATGKQGLQNQSDVFAQQQALASQLQQQAMGQGPNPAQAQLAQNTGNNIAQQAALMAGQRGSSANAGLLARQIGQQGGALQQQATGQAATLGAQQQIAAQQALMQQQAAMAGLAGTQVGQLQNQTNNYSNAAQNHLNASYNAVTGQNSSNNQSAQIQNQGNQANIGNISGLLGGIGGAAAGIGKMFAQGGQVGDQKTAETKVLPDKGYGKIIIINAHHADQQQMLANGGCASNVGNMLKAGGHVPGHAKVAGDSYANDTVNAKLSPGEIVIPRSIATHPNAPMEAAKFVAAIMARKGK